MNQDVTAILPYVLTAVEEAGLFVSLCTIQELPDAETSADSIGQPDEITYSNVAGLVDIPCMNAPFRTASPAINAEASMFDRVLETGDFHVLLDGHFPQIVQKQRALIAGVAYDIKDVESDSQSIMTRLACKRAFL